VAWHPNAHVRVAFHQIPVVRRCWSRVAQIRFVSLQGKPFVGMALTPSRDCGPVSESSLDFRQKPY
jgi:hypothetical protein